MSLANAILFMYFINHHYFYRFSGNVCFETKQKTAVLHFNTDHLCMGSTNLIYQEDRFFRSHFINLVLLLQIPSHAFQLMRFFHSPQSSNWIFLSIFLCYIFALFVGKKKRVSMYQGLWCLFLRLFFFFTLSLSRLRRNIFCYELYCLDRATFIWWTDSASGS